MDLKEKALEIVNKMEEMYPNAKCSLTYDKPHELLISTRLAAQCTDARVNIVTKELYEKYKSINNFAEADIYDIQNIIKSCGLYKTKSKDIVAMCITLRDKYNCKIPNTIEELIKLQGVGRKTANLVIGDIYGKPAVVVDTHCIRITNLLGLSEGKNPLQVEKQLRKILPMDKSNEFCHRIVIHGRKICVARKPKCNQCELKPYCSYYNSL